MYKKISCLAILSLLVACGGEAPKPETAKATSDLLGGQCTSYYYITSNTNANQPNNSNWEQVTYYENVQVSDQLFDNTRKGMLTACRTLTPPYSTTYTWHSEPIRGAGGFTCDLSMLWLAPQGVWPGLYYTSGGSCTSPTQNVYPYIIASDGTATSGMANYLYPGLANPAGFNETFIGFTSFTNTAYWSIHFTNDLVPTTATFYKAH